MGSNEVRTLSCYRVRPAGPLRGEVRVPGDKSIGHRALLFAGLADGESVLRGLSRGLDNHATARALRSMGVRTFESEGTLRVQGVGLSGLRMPVGPIDCGNSGTTMRLLAGLLVGQRFGARLVGDASLCSRPMGRVVEPLRARGARITVVGRGSSSELFAHLCIEPLKGREELRGIELDMPIASAQVKSALLLSGLYSRGPTVLGEPTLSRDHTERMMTALGLPITTLGPMVAFVPEGWDRRWDGFDWRVPGDFSSAAFLVAAAHLSKGSRIRIQGVGLNPTRTGLIDALRPMGSRFGVESRGAAAGDEPTGDIDVSYAPLVAGRCGGELLTRMVDEIPAFCVMAALASGQTEIRDAAELRVKESDRLSAMSEVLRAFGVPAEELPDGLVVRGGARLKAARVRSRGDHRIAMAAVILALGAEGESVVEDVSCVETSFPGFADTLRSLGAEVHRLEMSARGAESSGAEAS